MFNVKCVSSGTNVLNFGLVVNFIVDVYLILFSSYFVIYASSLHAIYLDG